MLKWTDTNIPIENEWTKLLYLICTYHFYSQVKVKNENIAFAMKCIKKKHVVDTKQQEHIYSEKRILEQICSPFIVK